VGNVNIELPLMLTADKTIGEMSDTWPYHTQWFIVLWFGDAEVARWEWQEDKPLEERQDLDDQDVSKFIADKLRAVLGVPN